MATKQTGTSTKKVRGPSKTSVALMEIMRRIAAETNPFTGRGVGYKLFSQGLIPSMERKEIKRVYRLLKEAREQGIIPWSWIVDETRELEQVASWGNPDQYAKAVIRSYRRDYWASS